MEEECEVCGKAEAEYEAVIEGARLKVCRRCSKLGTVVANLYEERRKEELEEIRAERKAKTVLDIEEELVEDYAKRIRDKMREMSINSHVLAERLNEQESYIERVVQGKMRPDEKLAHKIEKELNIKLFEEITAPMSKAFQEHKDMTLGDVIEIEKKKK